MQPCPQTSPVAWSPPRPGDCGPDVRESRSWDGEGGGEGPRGRRFADRPLLGSQSILRPGRAGSWERRRGGCTRGGRGVPAALPCFTPGRPPRGSRQPRRQRERRGAARPPPSLSPSSRRRPAEPWGGGGCPPAGLPQRPQSRRGSVVAL